jgi:hypothetical protein
MSNTNGKRGSAIIARLAKGMSSDLNKQRVSAWVKMCFTAAMAVPSAILRAASDPDAETVDNWLTWCDEMIKEHGLPVRRGNAIMMIDVTEESGPLGDLIDYAKTKTGRAPQKASKETKENMDIVYDTLTKKGAKRALILYGNKERRGASKLCLLESAALYFDQIDEKAKSKRIVSSIIAENKDFVFRSSSTGESSSAFVANRQNTWLYHQIAVMIAFAKRQGMDMEEFVNLCCEAALSANYGKNNKTTKLGIFTRCGIEYKITLADDLYTSPVCLTVNRIMQACGMIAIADDCPASIHVILSKNPSSDDWNKLGKAFSSSMVIDDVGERGYLQDELAHICNYWFTTKTGEYAVNWLKGNFLQVEFRQVNTNDESRSSHYSSAHGASGHTSELFSRSMDGKMKDLFRIGK